MATVTVKPAGDVETLVQTYQASVWRYLRYLGCDPPQADDLTQETFLAVHAKPFEEHSPEATAAYLRTVARNLFLMSLRRAKRQAIIKNVEVIDEVWQHYTAAGGAAAGGAADDGEAYREAMRDCVETLAGRARAAIDLCYRDQRSRCDIARELEMTEDGVKSLLRRTREILRKCVEGHVNGE